MVGGPRRGAEGTERSSRESLRRLASKYSLERHIRLKHKSNKAEVVEYSNSPNIDVDIVKKGIDIDSEQESDTELDNNNNNVIYANKAGWVETDNSESEESSMETDNKDIDSNENLETDNKKDIDNGGSEER